MTAQWYSVTEANFLIRTQDCAVHVPTRVVVLKEFAQKPAEVGRVILFACFMDLLHSLFFTRRLFLLVFIVFVFHFDAVF